MGIPHLFIYSLIDRHLGYFYLLAIMNTAAINIHIQFLFELLVPIPLGIYLSVESVAHIVILYLT